MTKTNEKNHQFKKIYDFLVLVISMAGYVPKHATIFRTLVIVASLGMAIYLGNYQADNSNLAISYFLLSETFYMGFIAIMLSENGLRNWFIKKSGGENNGYLAFEAILGFLFFHNSVSLGYIATANPGGLFNFIEKHSLFIIVAIMFIGGFTVKILAAKAVTVDIYYWKDMFFGKKISDFVITGPYKYFKNPMYGVGQLQAYAIAIWYGSAYGMMAALINQLFIFSFYYMVEKKFIKRVYQKETLQHTSKLIVKETVEIL